MPGFSVELEGHEAVRAAVTKAVDRLAHPKPLYDELGRMLTVTTQQRFEAERDPGGNPWPKSLRARLEGGKTLTDTGLLKGSITWEATDSGVRVGTDLLKAALLQFGGTVRPKTAKALSFALGGQRVTVKSVTIPARAFLGFSPEDESEIAEIAADWLADPLGAEGVKVDG